MQLMFDDAAAGATIVTANERLARTLHLAYNRRQRAAGRCAWRTPSILSWQAWISRLWSQSLSAGASAAERILLSPQQELVLWRHIVRGDACHLPGGETAVAHLTLQAWRECQNWRIGQTELDGSADSVDAATFARWASRYRQQCATSNWVDVGMLPGLLGTDLEQGRIHAPARVHLAGFVEWTPLQREFLRVIGRSCELREQSPPYERGARIRRVAFHDAEQELEYAARWARLRLERDPSVAIAIVVPDLPSRVAEVRRAVLDIFIPQWRTEQPEAYPVNFSYGLPLGSTGVVHAALLVLRALAGQPDYRVLGQLLRSPYVRAGTSESAARAALDLLIRDGPGMTVDLTSMAIAARSRAPFFSEVLDRLSAIGQSLQGQRPAGAWATTFRDALQAAGWPGERGLSSEEHQAVLAFDAELDAFAACDLSRNAIAFDDALGLLESLSREQLFQPAGSADAVQVMGVLEAVGQRFDALWICGLTSEHWPPSTRPHALIALELQRRLCMTGSSPALVRERAERLLRWLESSAPDVVLSWPQYRAEELLTVSPLIEHVPNATPDDLEVWRGMRRAVQLLTARTGELLSDDPAPPLDPSAIPLRGGAALLERQARCPARAFLEFRLGARELHRPSAGLDAATRGSILHAVLQGFFRRITSHGQLCRLAEGEEAELLRQLIDAELRSRLPRHDTLLRAVVAQEAVRLRRLITTYLQQERQREPFTVVATEEVLSLAAAPLNMRRLDLSLRLDRVDELADGRRLVLDYKTGRIGSGKDLWGARPRAPQLPLYAICADADAVAMVQISAAGTRWLGVGRGDWAIDGMKSPEKFTDGTCSNWGVLRAAWWSALDRLAGEIVQGDFRVDRWNLDAARGQWAMATRVFELPEVERPIA